MLLFMAMLMVLAVSSAQDEGEQAECVVGNSGECVNTDQDASFAATMGGQEEVVVDKNCPDRGHIIRCSGEYLDSNKNGKLDRFELDAAIGSLPW